MTAYLSQAQLRNLAATATGESGVALHAALDPANIELLAVTIVDASHLLPVYITRRNRWRRQGIPSAIGMEGFVIALENHKDSQVALLGFDHPTNDFIVLLRPDLTEILSTIAIAASAHLRRSGQANGSLWNPP